MDSSVDHRNECNSKAGGFLLWGIGKKEESTKCSSFDTASNNGEKLSVNRMESISYGVLPSEGVNRFVFLILQKVFEL